MILWKVIWCGQCMIMYGNFLEFSMTDYYGQCLDVWTGNMKLIDK